jgi:ribonuclease P protein component
MYRHPLVMLSLLPNGLTHNRYGFITSKYLGKAVVRNRMRRLLREAVRQCHPHLKSGFDLVWIARSELMGQPLAMIKRTVEELCERAGIVAKEYKP